jgi:hypothetical protein
MIASSMQLNQVLASVTDLPIQFLPNLAQDLEVLISRAAVLSMRFGAAFCAYFLLAFLARCSIVSLERPRSQELAAIDC